MSGRFPGTDGEKSAADYIESRFKHLGINSMKKHEYVQPFSFVYDSVEFHSYGNIIAYINAHSDKTIIIGAHYDHLGMGGKNSKEPFKKIIHNGADDNASGVAMLLALAEHYSIKANRPNVNIVFAAFSGEEEGLFGSEEFFHSNWIDTTKIFCYLNFDMVGSLDKTSPILAIEGIVENSDWNNIVLGVDHEKFSLRTVDPIFKGGSDHCTFANHGIPVLSFSTGITEDYHKSGDDADKLNYEGMVFIYEFVRNITDALSSGKVNLK